MNRLLIVDDEPIWLKTYKRIFRTKDYEIEYASSGTEALHKAAEFKPEIILLDIMMPGINGYQVCEDLKKKESAKDIDIIFISGQGKLDDRLKAYKLRASDFIVKPFSHDELLAKVELLIEKKNFYNEMASTDPLTKLGNRKFFETKYDNIFQISAQYNKEFSIGIIDIDFFKNVNDTYGHDMGDFVIIEMAKKLNTNFRDSDVFARIGGEEFAVVLPDTSRKNTRMVLERSRQDVENQVFNKPDSKHSLKITVSIGFASFPNDSIDQTDLFKKADIALYLAKNNGRNKVMPE